MVSNLKKFLDTHEGTFTTDELAEKVGVVKTTIYHFLKNHPKYKQRWVKFKKKSSVQIFLDNNEGNFTTRELKEKTNLSVWTIRDFFNAHPTYRHRWIKLKTGEKTSKVQIFLDNNKGNFTINELKEQINISETAIYIFFKRHPEYKSRWKKERKKRKSKVQIFLDNNKGNFTTKELKEKTNSSDCTISLFFKNHPEYEHRRIRRIKEKVKKNKRSTTDEFLDTHEGTFTISELEERLKITKSAIYYFLRHNPKYKCRIKKEEQKERKKRKSKVQIFLDNTEGMFTNEEIMEGVNIKKQTVYNFFRNNPEYRKRWKKERVKIKSKIEIFLKETQGTFTVEELSENLRMGLEYIKQYLKTHPEFDDRIKESDSKYQKKQNTLKKFLDTHEGTFTTEELMEIAGYTVSGVSRFFERNGSYKGRWDKREHGKKIKSKIRNFLNSTTKNFTIKELMEGAKATEGGVYSFLKNNPKYRTRIISNRKGEESLPKKELQIIIEHKKTESQRKKLTKKEKSRH